MTVLSPAHLEHLQLEAERDELELQFQLVDEESNLCDEWIERATPYIVEVSRTLHLSRCLANQVRWQRNAEAQFDDAWLRFQRLEYLRADAIHRWLQIHGLRDEFRKRTHYRLAEPQASARGANHHGAES